MGNSTYLLDFRHGRVEQIDEAVPPRGFSEGRMGTAPESLPARAGYVPASIGTPAPEEDDEE